MPLQVVWKEAAVPNRETGEEVIFTRGEMLPDWVDEFTAFVLTSSGGAKVVHEPDPALLAAGAPPAAVRLPEHPPEPLGAQTPAEAEQAAAEGEDATGAGDTADSGPKRPADTALKAEWVDYAVALTAASDHPLSKADAEAMSKAELISKFG